MMTIRKKMIAVSVLASTTVLVGFQNCTQTKFTPDSISSALSADGDIAYDPPADDGGGTGGTGDDGGGSGGGDVVVDPPADPVGASGSGKFQITSAEKGSVVLVCNKSKVNLTSLEGGKLILVNSHLDWITGVDYGSEVQFINSTASDKVKKRHSAFFKTLSSAEASEYIEKCAALPEVVIPESTPNYSTNQVTLAEALQVPLMANKYDITSVQKNVELVGLQSNSFSITSVDEGAHLQVKSKNFQGTSVEKNARLEAL